MRSKTPTVVDPVSESPINGGPFPEGFGQCSPSTPVFANVGQGSPKGTMIDGDIAALLRKKMFDTFVLCAWIVHDGR